MGPSEEIRQNTGEQVDLDADTKESTEEVFCQKDTAESPHRITCFYKPTLDAKIANNLPTSILRRQICREVKFGRSRTADVLLTEEHMSKEFATVTCRKSQTNEPSFYLRNVSKQKRILVNDENTTKEPLLPTQERELREKTSFRLECVEFVVGIELGDVDSHMFELVVKPLPQEGTQTNGYVNGATGYEVSTANPHVGLPIPNSRQQSQQGQINPIASPVFYPAYQNANGATAPYPHAQGVAGGMQPPMLSPYGQSPYIHNPAMQFGYPDLFSQPSAMHPSNMYPQSQAIPHQAHSSQVYQPAVTFSQMMNQPQLLERGVGSHLAPAQPCPHHPGQSPYNMSAMSQTLQKIAEPSPQSGLSPRGIVANPSSQDSRPVLYPSPANQRFRFPEPQMGHQGQLSPDLSNLPRGPPLGSLSSSRSVDLHPAIPQNVVTTHPVSESGQSRDSRQQDQKFPVEHEDKPK